MNSAKINVLLIDADDNLTLKVARCLGHQPGLKTHVLSHIETPLPLRHSRYVSSYGIHPDTDEGWLDAIGDTIKRRSIDVLCPIKETAVRFISRNRDQLEPLAALHPVTATDTFEIATEKGKLAEFLTRHDLEVPKTIRHRSDQDFEQELDAMQFPVLLKPATGAWGQNIHRCDTAAETRAFLRTDAASEHNYLVQSYIVGRDIDCSVLCRDGRVLAYTIQEELTPNTVSFKAPLAIKFVHDQRVLHVVETLMARLNWNGVAHLDLRYDQNDDRLYIIEINGRYWGSLLGSLSAGVNFPYLACRTALGETFPLPVYDLGPYLTARECLRQALQNPFSLTHFRYTPLRYTLRDPLPDLAAVIRS
jgi:predicted ATP-grasp superfamily ATP-dependent carboligase